MNTPAAWLETMESEDNWEGHVQRFPVRDGMTIGRARIETDVDLAIRSARVGSRQAIISVRDGRYWIRDAGSPSGTYVNDEHIRFNGERALREGDIIRFGGVKMRFTMR